MQSCFVVFRIEKGWLLEGTFQMLRHNHLGYFYYAESMDMVGAFHQISISRLVENFLLPASHFFSMLTK